MGNAKAADKLAGCTNPMDLIFSKFDAYLCMFPLNMDVKDAGPLMGSGERHNMDKSMLFKNFAIQEGREKIAHHRPYKNWGGARTAAPGCFCQDSWRDIVKMMIKHPTKDYIDTEVLLKDMSAMINNGTLVLPAEA